MFDDYRPRDFAVRLWDGSAWDADAEPRAFTLVLKHPGALRAMFWPPNELSIAEAYLRDDYDIEGDIEACFPVADYLLIDRPSGPRARLKEANSLVSLPRPAARRGRAEGPRGFAADGTRSNAPAERSPTTTTSGTSSTRSSRIGACSTPARTFGRRTTRSTCSGAEARPHLPQAPPAAGRAAARHRLRLGRARCTPRRTTGSRCSASRSASRRLIWRRSASRPPGSRTVPRRGARLSRGRRSGWLRQDRLDRDVRAHREGRAAGVLRDVLASARPAASSSTTGSASRRRRAATRRLVHDGVRLPGLRSRADLDELRRAEAAGFEVRDVESLREHYALTARAWRRGSSHGPPGRRARRRGHVSHLAARDGRLCLRVRDAPVEPLAVLARQARTRSQRTAAHPGGLVCLSSLPATPPRVPPPRRRGQTPSWASSRNSSPSTTRATSTSGSGTAPSGRRRRTDARFTLVLNHPGARARFSGLRAS